MPIDDVVLPLCDVKRCHQPQCGEPLEILSTAYSGVTQVPKLMVRIRPCSSHYGLFLEFGATTVGRGSFA